jgi:sigma-B regulation protein RsbU (phosphoserine phosphatase)
MARCVVLHVEYQRDILSFCTAVFGLLAPDGDGFTFTFASGGHPEPLLLRADGSATYQDAPRGLLIGVEAGGTYTATTLQLRPGDTLVLYTDGLTEAQTGSAGGRYNPEALRSYLGELGPAAATKVVEAIAALLDGFSAGLVDDIAVLALSVPAAQRGESADGQVPGRPHE